MSIPRTLGIIAGSLLASSAWAQSSSQPLNLKLPPGSLVPAPASSSSAPPAPRATSIDPVAASKASAPASTSTAPGVYYGDTSGRTYADTADATVQSCDDSTYNQPQVHGSVGMGVVGGNHVSGNYQTGTINVSKALGSCDHPTGHVGISISVGKGDFRDHRWGH